MQAATRNAWDKTRSDLLAAAKAKVDRLHPAWQTVCDIRTAWVAQWGTGWTPVARVHAVRPQRGALMEYLAGAASERAVGQRLARLTPILERRRTAHGSEWRVMEQPPR